MVICPPASPEGPSLPLDIPTLPAPVPPAPVPAGDPPLEHYKGTALKNIGRDKNGKVIPHKRSEITAKKVSIWVAAGYNVNDIAVFLNIRPGLVKECYGREINHGEQLVGMDMSNHIVARAKKSDRMAIFYAKARMGWRDGDTKAPETGLLNIHIHT